MKAVYAIIIAGGNGERFWPVSTSARPKQFVSLFGGRPLIRQALERLRGLVPPERTFVVTAHQLVAETRRALPELPATNVVGEPCRRDTSAAIAVACGLVRRFGGPDAVGCVLTADHLIEPPARFRRALRDAIFAARRIDSIVTLGIEPTSPATGFGYIELGKSLELARATPICRVRRFVEKPDVTTAKRYLRSGRFKWNSGMFIWRADVLTKAFAKTEPPLAALVEQLAGTKSVDGTLRRAYPALRTISFDYAVVEKLRNLAVALGDFAWDDVGSWTAIPNHFPSDASGNVCFGRTALFETKGSVVVSDERHLTAVVGLENIAVVHTADATLVCALDRVQDVKKLVRSLPQERIK